MTLSLQCGPSPLATSNSENQVKPQETPQPAHPGVVEPTAGVGQPTGAQINGHAASTDLKVSNKRVEKFSSITEEEPSEGEDNTGNELGKAIEDDKQNKDMVNEELKENGGHKEDELSQDEEEVYYSRMLELTQYDRSPGGLTSRAPGDSDIADTQRDNIEDNRYHDNRDNPVLNQDKEHPYIYLPHQGESSDYTRDDFQEELASRVQHKALADPQEDQEEDHGFCAVSFMDRLLGTSSSTDPVEEDPIEPTHRANLQEDLQEEEEDDDWAMNLRHQSAFLQSAGFFHRQDQDTEVQDGPYDTDPNYGEQRNHTEESYHYPARDYEETEYDARGYDAREYQARGYRPQEYQARDYGPEEYQARDNGPQEYQARDYGPQEYQARDYGPQEYQARDYGPQEYQARGYGPQEYQTRDYEPQEYQARDYGPQEYQDRARGYEPREYGARDYEPRQHAPRDYEYEENQARFEEDPDIKNSPYYMAPFAFYDDPGDPPEALVAPPRRRRSKPQEQVVLSLSWHGLTWPGFLTLINAFISGTHFGNVSSIYSALGLTH